MTANAQEQSDSAKVVRLQDVVITASRLKEELASSPVTIEKISRGEFRQSAIVLG